MQICACENPKPCMALKSCTNCAAFLREYIAQQQMIRQVPTPGYARGSRPPPAPRLLRSASAIVSDIAKQPTPTQKAEQVEMGRPLDEFYERRMKHAAVPGTMFSLPLNLKQKVHVVLVRGDEMGEDPFTGIETMWRLHSAPPLLTGRVSVPVPTVRAVLEWCRKLEAELAKSCKERNRDR